MPCHPPSRIRTLSVQVRKGDRIFVANNILDVSVGEREISPSHIPVLQEFDGLSQNGASCESVRVDGLVYLASLHVWLSGRVCVCACSPRALSIVCGQGWWR